MARKNPLPPNEKAICARLGEFRRSIRLSRVAFAEELGIGTFRLANYERVSVPLPYSIGSKICESFDLSQAWLAEGVGPVRGSVIIDPREEEEVPRGALFSEVYEVLVKPVVQQSREGDSFLELLATDDLAKARMAVEQLHVVGGISAATVEAILAKMHHVAMAGLPPHLRWPYYKHVMDASAAFQSTHISAISQYSEIAKAIPQLDRSQKYPLTDVHASVKHKGVKAQLPTLLERLRRATLDRGKKSVLAKYLGVSLASASQWLSGAREPGGETTLRLLEWVQAEESNQQKSPGSATNTARAKAQLRKSSYEKPKPGPRKT